MYAVQIPIKAAQENLLRCKNSPTLHCVAFTTIEFSYGSPVPRLLLGFDSLSHKKHSQESCTPSNFALPKKKFCVSHNGTVFCLRPTSNSKPQIRYGRRFKVRVIRKSKSANKPLLMEI